MIRSLLDTSSQYLQGITLDRLDAEKSVQLNLGDERKPFLPFAQGEFQTPSRKFEFGAANLDYSAPVESRLGNAELLKKFPLELISSKNDDGMNSTFGHRAEVSAQTGRISIHASDAAQRGIVAGSKVKVFNERGACYFTASIDDDVQMGVLRAASVGWSRDSRDRLGINHLTSERLTDIGGGPTFFSCLVEVALA
jgi:anaerobic selenocysteine-containing dehydrogenase